jgi:hypothetical protein
MSLPLISNGTLAVAALEVALDMVQGHITETNDVRATYCPSLGERLLQM